MKSNPRPTAIKLLAIIFSFFIHAAAQAQCEIPSSKGDSTFPVTNKYNIRYNSYFDVAAEWGSGIYKVALDKGRYFLHGFFSNLVKNHGPALIIDSNTNTVKTPQKWKVNGGVIASVPDGQGGFYIAGDFTKIGDSSRPYLARINANGQPAAWNPQANGIVRALQIRGNILYIGGDFTSIFSKPRTCFAMYSLTGDTLHHSAIKDYTTIYNFLLQKDTLIFGGYGPGMRTLRKYNMKTAQMMNWVLEESEYLDVNFLEFNEDSSVIVFHDEDYSIRGVRTATGKSVYEMEMAQFTPGNYGSGKALAMSRLGDKIYVTGYFEKVRKQSTVYNRFSFFSFNATTGSISPDVIKTDGMFTFVKAVGNKLFLSGNFNLIDTISRLNFAVVDTGTFSLGFWQIDPSDPITTMSFNNNNVFVGGHFSGVKAIRRRGYAAVDSATGEILPWNPSINPFKIGDMDMEEQGKRMFVRGDTVFILSGRTAQGGCEVNVARYNFHVYRISNSGPVNWGSINFSKMYDFTIEGDYIYASVDGRLRRYSLQTFAQDAGWGFDYANEWNNFKPTYILVRGDTVFAIGDNRYDQGCSPNIPLKGFIYLHKLSDGKPIKKYEFAGKNPSYDFIAFDHALIAGKKVYIEGEFDMLNGKPRHDFVCIDISSGEITDWAGPFLNTVAHLAFRRSSDLQLHNGLIWFGSASFYDTAAKKSFYGFGAVDTVSGVLMPTLFRLSNNNLTSPWYRAESAGFHDFVFTGNHLIAVGEFDQLDGAWHSNIVKLALKPGSSPPAHSVNITGPDTVLANIYPHQFSIAPADTSYTYRWKYTGAGVTFIKNGDDTARLVADTNATSGTLMVMAANYCGETLVAQKNIVIADPPPLPVPALKDLNDRCVMDFSHDAKLTNYPPYASLTITRDGLPVSYKPVDSSFEYFSYVSTQAGQHTIRVKYKFGVDSTEKEFTFNVDDVKVPAITISGLTTVNAGTAIPISTFFLDHGGVPGFQWQDSTNLHDWQNITGAMASSLNYTPVATGNKLRCVLSVDGYCTWPPMVISNALSFTVNTPTGIDPVEVLSNSIQLYPNPASSVIIIDSLKLSDHWRTLEILDLAGQKQVSGYSIQNKTRVTITVRHLANGYYVVVLRSKDGTVARKAFVKG